MKTKQLLRLAVLLVPLLAAASFAGIYYEQEMKLPGQTMKSVCYISGSKMRSEMQAMGASAVSILRLDQGKMYQLMPDSKMYMEMAIPKQSPEVEAQVQVTVTKTAETKKIGNYNCTRYDVTTKGMPGLPPQGMTAQWWTTTDVDVADEFAKFTDAQLRSQSTKQATEMAKVKGFLIQMVTETPGGAVTMTVTTVKKQDVPDSMFEVPADYTKMTMPGTEAVPPAPTPQGGGAAE